MKFTDINQELTEAPDLSKIKGKLQRAGTKIKSKNPLSKEMRIKSGAKSNVQQTGLKIKDQFHAWVGETGSKQTLEDFKIFIDQNVQELSDVFDEIAVELEFKKPEPEPEPETQADDSADQQVEPDAKGDQEDLISPEKMTGKKRELTPDEQAGFDKINRDAEEEAAGFEKQELNASKGDNEKPKVDMSASIYESRLKAFLTEATKLSDNQLDTLIVRLMQAAKKGGVDTSAQQQDTGKETPAKPAKPAKPGKEEKGDGWRQKISKALTGTGNVSDIGGGDSGSDSGGSAAPNIDPADLKALTGLLATVARGKTGPNEKKVAGKLLKSIQNTYGE